MDGSLHKILTYYGIREDLKEYAQLIAFLSDSKNNSDSRLAVERSQLEKFLNDTPAVVAYHIQESRKGKPFLYDTRGTPLYIRKDSRDRLSTIDYSTHQFKHQL